MARLRHFAVCVNDLDKAAAFYSAVFDLKRIAREDLEDRVRDLHERWRNQSRSPC